MASARIIHGRLADAYSPVAHSQTPESKYFPFIQGASKKQHHCGAVKLIYCFACV